MTVRHRPDKKTKDGRAYCFDVNYTDTFGRYKHYTSKMYKTSKEAREQEAIFIYNLDNYTKQEDKSIRELVAGYKTQKQANLKPASFDRLCNHLNHIESQLGKIKASKLNANQLEDFKKYLTSVGYTAKTKNQVLADLQQVMKYGFNHYNIHNNIVERVERFKDKSKRPEMQFLTFDEFQLFISNVAELKYRAFFTVLYYEGLRLSEANGLQWKHTDFERNIITINQRAFIYKGELTISSPKTENSYRVIPMSQPVITALKELLECYKQDSAFNTDYFVFGGDYILSKTSISRKKEQALKRSKIDKKIRIHDFRHSCASLLVNNNANITVVSRFLGHASIKETLDIYSHMYTDKLNEVVAIINEKTATPE